MTMRSIVMAIAAAALMTGGAVAQSGHALSPLPARSGHAFSETVSGVAPAIPAASRPAGGAARSALLGGVYACQSLGRATGADLVLGAGGRYALRPGGAGQVRYPAGAVRFASGPLAGVSGRVLDARTLTIGAHGAARFGQRCIHR